MPKNTSNELVCVAEFFAREGKDCELLNALRELIEPTRMEAGCLRYELNQRTDNNRWITFVEKWKSRESFDQHCAMPYIKHYFDEVRPGLVDQFEVKIYKEIHP